MSWWARLEQAHDALATADDGSDLASREERFVQALDDAYERLAATLAAAATGASADWREQLRGGLGELLDFIAGHPAAAWILCVESRSSSRRIADHRELLLERAGTDLDAYVRAQLEGATPRSPAITGTALVGGIDALLFSRVYRGETDRLEQLLPTLVDLVTRAYGERELIDSD